MLRVDANNLGFSREGIRIFSDVSFSVSSGELLWVKGDNGSGKTTLLRIIAGILRNFSGEISFHREQPHAGFENRSADNLPEEGMTHIGSRLVSKAHKNDTTCIISPLGEITYIGEKLACDDEYTVLDNLLFWAKLRKCTELLAATLEFFNLSRIAHVEVKKLSSGWKKRVSLAKLLLFNSKIWILDEPFTYLDKESIKLFTQLFSARLEQRGTIFLVNHGDLDTSALNVKELLLR